MKLGVVILAAGQGTRMKSGVAESSASARRKTASRTCHAILRVEPEADRIAVVYGHGGERVPDCFPDPDLVWVEQAQQLGTGHAAEQALPAMAGMDRILVFMAMFRLSERDPGRIAESR